MLSSRHLCTFMYSLFFLHSWRVGGGEKELGNLFNMEWCRDSITLLSMRKLVNFNGIHQQFKWHCRLLSLMRNSSSLALPL